MRPTRFCIFWLAVLGFHGIQSLKCRSQDGTTDAELKKIVRSCMQRSGNNINNSEDNNYNNNDNECQGPQCRRYGNNQNQNQNHNQRHNFDASYYGLEEQRSSGRNRSNYGQQYSNNNSNKNNNSESGFCVAHCFFEEMNMVDGNGLPDRRKVSYLLTKDIRERELRNFYMDTVQQCFRYLENYRNSKCAQSRELIKCMSEYAKAQCDDWEEYNNILFN